MKSGFITIESSFNCAHEEHEAPAHTHIPRGRAYIHICPGCTKAKILSPHDVALEKTGTLPPFHYKVSPEVDKFLTLKAKHFGTEPGEMLEFTLREISKIESEAAHLIQEKE